MELTYKDYKKINNTGSLPGFVNGLVRPWNMILDNGGFNDYTRNAISQGGNSKLPTESWLIPYSNTPKTPRNEVAQTFDMSKGGDVVSTGVNFAGNAVNGFIDGTGEDDLAAKYGQSYGYVDGIGYTKLNMADVEKERDEIHKSNLKNTLGTVGAGAAFGATVGSIVPGLGTIFGGLIGAGLGGILGGIGSAERARKHRQLVARFNDKVWDNLLESRGGAFTTALRLNNAKRYGNSESQYLFGAANGKQPEVNSKTGHTKDNVWMYTPRGYKFGKANALGEPGETMLDTETGEISTIPYRPGDSKHPGDVLPIEAKKETAIFTNRWIDPVTGKSFAKAAIDGDDDPYALLNRMKILVNDNKSKKGLMKAKCGKLPKYYEGWVPNAISSGATMLGGLTLYLDAKNQSVKKPNSYVSNPYELEALSTLAGLRINPYPIMQQLRSAEYRTNNAIDRSGGLGVGLRKLSRLSALNTTQNNISNTLSSILLQNNNYLSDYAKTALQAGANNAKMKMAADQYDLDYYSKAHAARQLGMQAGIYNMINGLQQYYANDFKRRQFNDMMGLYRQQLSLDLQRLLHDLYGNGSSFAKNMENYTRNQKNQYLINKVATNPAFDPTKALTYRNLTGRYLSGDKYLKIG